MARPSDNPQYLELMDEIQRLRDEQQRLRDEQERLRREATSHDGAGAHTGNHQPGAEEPQKEDQREKSQQSEQQRAAAKNEKEMSDAEEPKPPLRERARSFYAEHKTGVVFGLLGLVLLCIAAFFLLRYLSSYESTDDAQIDGYLNAIGARISGQVTRVYVDQNQFVNAGQLLVELDPSDYQNALEQAKASYGNAVAQMRGENPNVPIIQTTSKTTISTGQADVVAAQAGLTAAEQQYQGRLADQAQAEANNAKAQRDLARYRGLVERQEISREQYDQVVASATGLAASVQASHAAANAAQKSIDQARAALLQAQTRLNEANVNAPRSLAIRQAGVEARQAAVLAAKAEVDQATLNLSYAKIYAPVSGIVTQRSVDVGQSVAPGQQLVMISQINNLWVTANFKETQIRKMRPGQAVTIQVDAYKRKYKGYVEYMAGATGAITSLLPPENATGNYVKVVQRLPIRIRLYQDQDREHRLRPGMSVEPKVWLN